MDLNKNIKKLDICDISLIKATSFLFALLLVGFFPQIASLEWYWYALAILLLAYRPVKKYWS